MSAPAGSVAAGAERLPGYAGRDVGPALPPSLERERR